MMVITVDWEGAPRTGCAGGFPAGSNRTVMESRPAEGAVVLVVHVVVVVVVWIWGEMS